MSGYENKDGILTVTFNPAVDKTVFVDGRFRAGELNRSSASLISCGGKGINVSRALCKLGCRTTAVGFCGGIFGEILKNGLEREQVPHSLVQTAAQTRMNIKIIDSFGGCTEVNDSGYAVTFDETEQLFSLVKRESEKYKVVVIAGSFPQGVENNVQNLMINKLSEMSIRVVCDMSGDRLRAAVKAHPYMIKPNIHELSELIGKPVESFEEAVENSERIYKKTGVTVLCTVGKSGSVYSGVEGTYIANAPEVAVRGFAGAGDTYLAAFLCSRFGYPDGSGSAVKQNNKKYTSESPDNSEKVIICAMKTAASAAAAAVECPGTELPEACRMMELRDIIKVKRIS